MPAHAVLCTIVFQDPHYLKLDKHSRILMHYIFCLMLITFFATAVHLHASF